MARERFRLSEKVTTERDLASWIDQIKDRERQRNRLLTVQWLENIAAFHGFHDLRASQDLKIYQRLSRRQENELNDIGMNFVLPHIRTLVSKAVLSRPIIQALPASSDESDIQAARYSDQLLTGEWTQQEMEVAKVEIATYVGATGNAFVHQFFDPRLGLPVFEGINEGRIASRVSSPLKICLEPHRNNVRKCRWGVISEFSPIDELEEIYKDEYEQRTGAKLEILGAEKRSEGTQPTDLWVRSYLNMVGAVEHRDPGLDESDYAEVDILYHLPTARYPHGLYAVKVGDLILSVGRYPYPFLGRLPFLHFREIMSPWRLFGEASVNEVLKNQDMYIRLRRVERDYHLQNTNKKILAPKGARIKRERLASPYTEVIDYNPVGADGGRPTIVPPQPLPGGIYQSLKLTIDERQLAGGITDSTQGLPPSGITAGKALLALQAQDDAKLAPMALMNEFEFGIWGQNTLLMAKEFYSERRKYAIAGEAGAGSVFFFDRARIGETTDVVCQPGTALPKNKLAEKEQIRADFVSGIYGIPQTPEAQLKVRKMLAIGMSEDVQDDEVVHRQVSEKENINQVNAARAIVQALENQGVQVTPEILSGAVMPIQDFDHDEIHLRNHIRRLNTAGVVDQPMIYWVLAQHAIMHQQRIQERQMQIQQAMAGPAQAQIEPTPEPQPEQRPPSEPTPSRTDVSKSLPNGGELRQPTE